MKERNKKFEKFLDENLNKILLGGAVISAAALVVISKIYLDKCNESYDNHLGDIRDEIENWNNAWFASHQESEEE